MVATAANKLPLTVVRSHRVDAVECWATRLSGATTLISVCNSGLQENRDVPMKGDNRRKKRKRRDPKVQIQGMGDCWELSFYSKHTVQYSFSHWEKCDIHPRHDLNFVISQGISFALLLLGCRLPQHALVPVPGG